MKAHFFTALSKYFRKISHAAPMQYILYGRYFHTKFIIAMNTWDMVAFIVVHSRSGRQVYCSSFSTVRNRFHHPVWKNKKPTCYREEELLFWKFYLYLRNFRSTQKCILPNEKPLNRLNATHLWKLNAHNENEEKKTLSQPLQSNNDSDSHLILLPRWACE